MSAQIGTQSERPPESWYACGFRQGAAGEEGGHGMIGISDAAAYAEGFSAGRNWLTRTQNAETVADALWEQFVHENGTKSRMQAAADALVASGVVPKRVIIEVDGGIARVSYVSPGVEVQIIDHDEDHAPIIELMPAWCAHGMPAGAHVRMPCSRCHAEDDNLPPLNVCRCVEESDCPHNWEDAR